MDNIEVKVFSYGDGRKGIQLVLGNYHQSVTVNGDFLRLKENEVAIKDYGETANCFALLVQRGIIEPKFRTKPLGVNEVKITKLIV